MHGAQQPVTEALLPILRQPGLMQSDPRQQVAPDQTTNRIRILVVDDEEMIRSLLGRVLGSDHDVTYAASGSDAQTILLHDRSFDLLLCDLLMGDLSGLELHQWLTETDHRLAQKMIFMTGGVVDPQTDDYLRRTGNPRIAKPFDMSLLKLLVRNIADFPPPDEQGPAGHSP